MTDKNYIETYKTYINKYYLIGYRWKDEIIPMLSVPNKEFMKFTNNIDGISMLETINVLVAYSYFKIISIDLYQIENDLINTYNSNSLEHNQLILNYINNEANMNKIKKISIKITENDKIFTISDGNYNIYSIEDIKNNSLTNSLKSISALVDNYLERIIS